MAALLTGEIQMGGETFMLLRKADTNPRKKTRPFLLPDSKTFSDNHLTLDGAGSPPRSLSLPVGLAFERNGRIV
jgi:hypothetical protein